MENQNSLDNIPPLQHIPTIDDSMLNKIINEGKIGVIETYNSKLKFYNYKEFEEKAFKLECESKKIFILYINEANWNTLYSKPLNKQVIHQRIFKFNKNRQDYTNPRRLLFSEPFIDKIDMTMPFNENSAESILDKLIESDDFVEKRHNELFYLYKRTFIGKDELKHFEISLFSQERSDYKIQNEVRISINPNKFSSEQLSYIFGLVKMACPNNYYQVMRKAKITRIDVAADIYGLRMNSFMLDSRLSNKSRIYYDKHGEVQTLWFGSGRNTSKLYDKSQEIYDKTSEKLPYRSLRLELQLREVKSEESLQMTLDGLSQIGSCYLAAELYLKAPLRKCSAFKNGVSLDDIQLLTIPVVRQCLRGDIWKPIWDDIRKDLSKFNRTEEVSMYPNILSEITRQASELKYLLLNS